MTPPTRSIARCAAAGLLLAALSGCDGSSPRNTGATALAPAGQSALGDSAAKAAREVVQAFIWESTEEGSPYFIEANATRFDRFGEEVTTDDGRVTCTAVFRSDDSEFLLEYTLERDMEAYVITRIVLKTVDGKPAERLLFDRASLIR